MKEGMCVRRILLYVAVLFLFGVGLAGFAPIPPTALSVFLLTGIPFLILLLFLQRHQRGSRPIPLWLLALFFVLGGFAYSQSYSFYYPNLLQPYYESQVQVVGTVEDNPVYRNGKWQYTLRLESLSMEGEPAVRLRDRVRISDLRNPFDPQNEPSPISPVTYGDRAELKGLLLTPSETRNPGGYNDREYLQRQAVHARMTVRTNSDLRIIGSDPGLYGRTISRLQQKVWDTLHLLFPAGEAELAGGLVFGFAADLPDPWEESFAALGITHILAASGMNVGLLAGAVMYLFKYLRIRQLYASLAAIGLIGAYVLLSGAGPSVVRAGIMTTLVIVGLSLGRQADMLTTLAIAAILSSLWNPNMTEDIGFLLSFVTTLGLLLITPRLLRWIPGPFWLRSALAVTVAAQISSLPLLVYFFNQISPWSILANLYIMPITFLLVPFGIFLILLGMVHGWLALPFIGLYRLLMWLLVHPVVVLADATTDWTWSIPSPPLWGVFLIYGGLICLLNRRTCVDAMVSRFQMIPRRVKLMIPIIIVIPAVILLVRLHSPELRVTFLDVGQGDSALVETPGGMRILVDGGGIPSYLQSDFDVGKRIVIPFLRHRGIRTLDYMVATHADEDHVRGLIAVMQKMKVRHLIVSGYNDPGQAFQELLRTAERKGVPIYRSQVAREWRPESNLTFRFMHPDQIRTGTRSDTNANSVVFELAYGNRTFLFTGDIEGEVESDLFPYLRPVDVLKVPHHGSHYSSTEELLNRLHPSYAIISVGKRNRYHHPHAEVLNRLRSIGARVLRTDENGAITVTTDGDRLRVETEVKH